MLASNANDCASGETCGKQSGDRNRQSATGCDARASLRFAPIHPPRTRIDYS